MTPSGRFPLVLSRPDGSFNAGMSAFAIARHTMSFSAPKMLHTLRCSPCVNHPCLEMFDNLLRNGIGTTCNLALQWLQASLAVKDGGLGVRRVSSMAPSAFLASAAATATHSSNSCYFTARALGPLKMLQCSWSGTNGRQRTLPSVPPVQQQPNSQHGTEPSLHYKDKR